jgi:hypothetical protein
MARCTQYNATHSTDNNLFLVFHASTYSFFMESWYFVLSKKMKKINSTTCLWCKLIIYIRTTSINTASLIWKCSKSTHMFLSISLEFYFKLHSNTAYHKLWTSTAGTLQTQLVPIVFICAYRFVFNYWYTSCSKSTPEPENIVNLAPVHCDVLTWQQPPLPLHPKIIF